MLHWNSGGYTAQSLASFAAEAGSIHIQATKPDAVGKDLKRWRGNNQVAHELYKNSQAWDSPCPQQH